jgi:hypothetical protein
LSGVRACECRRPEPISNAPITLLGERFGLNGARTRTVEVSWSNGSFRAIHTVNVLAIPANAWM